MLDPILALIAQYTFNSNSNPRVDMVSTAKSLPNYIAAYVAFRWLNAVSFCSEYDRAFFEM